jgi:ATP-binding cassette subfamily F protein uup
MNLLSVNKLGHAFDEAALFDDVSFGVDEGERVALVGPNGAGKTTLLRILAGEIEPARGECVMQAGSQVGYLPQRVAAAGAATPREVVARAVAPIREAIARHDEVSARIGQMGRFEAAMDDALVEQAALAERVARLGGWDWERRVEEMVDRLGLTGVMRSPMANLSGGQRRRVDLARTLLSHPDLLLLDEPTNHLDTDAVDWLQGWLAARPGALILVTHDRYFLERVAGRILELDTPNVYDHPADYQTFITRRFERMEQRERAGRRRGRALEVERERLDRQLRGKQGRSQHHVNRVEQLAADLGQAAEPRMEMGLSDGPDFGRTVLSASGLYVSRGGEDLLEAAGLSLTPRERIGIVGPNGCGKTTFLETLVGARPARAGVLEVGEHTVIGYMPQTGLEVEPGQTVYDVLGPSDYVWVGDRKFHKQRLLERFLFDRRLQRAQVSVLSGGQRRRLALARLVAANANVLVMDEPTNDLDIISLQVLEEALIGFQGCALIVSHDRYFMERVCTAIVAFEGKRLVRYEGSWEDYRRALDRRLEAERAARAQANKASKVKAPRRAPTPSEKPSYKDALELERVEADITLAEERLGEIDAALADPDLYANRTHEIEPLNRERQEVEAALEGLYERWAELEERAGG